MNLNSTHVLKRLFEKHPFTRDHLVPVNPMGELVQGIGSGQTISIERNQRHTFFTVEVNNYLNKFTLTEEYCSNLGDEHGIITYQFETMKAIVDVLASKIIPIC